MVKDVCLPSIFLLIFLIRLLITGANIGDALIIVALSTLWGFCLFLKDKKEPEANKELKNRLVETEETLKILKDKVNSINFGSQLKR